MTESGTQQTEPTAPLPWAMSITDASRMVGMSTGQFRRVFINSRRIETIHAGKRDRVIDTRELRSAYEQWITDCRET